MPLYSYACRLGHTVDHLCKYEEKPEWLACTCGEVARPTIGLPAAGVVTGSKNPLRIVPTARTGYVEESPGVWVKGASALNPNFTDYRCTTCGVKGVAVDEPMPARCACGGEVEVYDNPNMRPADWFPHGGYFDRALGVHVESRAHRARLLAERGLREADGAEIDDSFRAASAKRSQEDADIKEMLKEWDDDKERARLIDEGHTSDHQWAKDVMGV